MIGSPNGAKASRAGTTPRTTVSAGPRTAVTGSGTASVIHQTRTQATTARSPPAAAPRPGGGKARSRAKAAGPRTSPAARRRLSKRASASERRPSAGGGRGEGRGGRHRQWEV